MRAFLNNLANIPYKYFLCCGILATILYFLTDLTLSFIYPGYVYRDQAVSELSAMDAPTRNIWLAMTFIYNPLIIAFGIGVWFYAKNYLKLKVTAALIVIWGLTGYVWLFFPMHQVKDLTSSTTDTMHLVLAAITVLLFVLFISVGSSTQNKLFFIYSLLTIVIMLFFGYLTAQQVPRIAAHLPTKWMGITERISVYLPMIWVSVLAIKLLKNDRIS